MQPAEVLRGARRRAGLTQRALAARAALPYSTVARIEGGAVVPRVDTLERLLRVCGEGLESRPRRGGDVDRTLIRQQLARSPAQRLALAVESARRVSPLIGAAARTRRARR